MHIYPFKFYLYKNAMSNVSREIREQIRIL